MRAAAAPSERAPLHSREGRKRREKATRRMRRSALPYSAGPWREKASGTGRDHPASTGGEPLRPLPPGGKRTHGPPPPHQRVSHPPTPRVSSDPAEGGLHLPREDGVRLRRFWERTASLRNAPFRRCPGWASRRFFGEKPAQIYCWAFFSGWLCPPPPAVAPGGGAKALQGAGHVNVAPRDAICGRGYANRARLRAWLC